VHDGFVYLYGDLYLKDRQPGPGVIRQFSFHKDAQKVPQLRDTGLEIRLVRHGENVINHPTGLTWNSTYGTFLGDTVTRTKKGTIYHLNWSQMLIDRNLDRAILNVIDDDLAIQGCRPEFVRRDQRWLLASADYGPVKNAVRFYDPELLSTVRRTSSPSVLVGQVSTSPWVQQLHWVDSRNLLVLAQNQIEGRRWRLTVSNPWKVHSPDGLASVPPYDAITDTTELEGFTMLDHEFCVLVSSSRTDNVVLARVTFPSP